MLKKQFFGESKIFKKWLALQRTGSGAWVRQELLTEQRMLHGGQIQNKMALKFLLASYRLEIIILTRVGFYNFLDVLKIKTRRFLLRVPLWINVKMVFSKDLDDKQTDPYNEKLCQRQCQVFWYFFLLKVDALLSLGLDSFGYNTLTIDDYWQLPERDTSGRWKTKTNTNNCVICSCNNQQIRMVPDPEKFPNGIKFLADYFHERF